MTNNRIHRGNGGLVESFVRDVRLGLRSLVRRPAFLSLAVVTLSLGIGASTAIFGVVEAALLRPLPFREPARLGMIWGVFGPDREVRAASYVEVADWRRLTRSFETISVYNEMNANLSGDGPAQQVEAETVSAGFFEMLGVAPALGRTLSAADDTPGTASVAVISDDLWRARFGGDRGIVGRIVRLDGRSFEIVGVMPPRFKGLSFDTDLWMTQPSVMTAADLESRTDRWLGAVGRLRAGVSWEAAQADLTEAAGELERQHPESNRDRSAELFTYRGYFLDAAGGILWMLLGGVGLLLLIACANVANVQLVRTSDRRGELSIRLAMGASRSRIARQLVTESVILALIGSAGGVLLASFALELMVPLIPQGALPTYVAVRLNPVVVGFAVAVALMSGVVMGLIPAWRMDAAPANALKGSRATVRGRRVGRVPLQRLIVGIEVAVALVLLVSAGLAIGGFRRQLAIDPGFRADGVLAARINLPDNRYDRTGSARFAAELLERVRALPGVRNAAVGSDAPLRGDWNGARLQREGHPDDAIRYYRHRVTPEYFQTLEIGVARGRAFTDADREGAPGVVVVSEALAAKLWPGEEALGKRLVIFDEPSTVVGIARNVHFRDLTTSLMDPGEDPDVYFPHAQFTPTTFDVLARTNGDPVALTESVRRAVTQIDPELALYSVAPLSSALSAQTALGRLTSSLLTAFGVMSLLLAAVGLYGVMAFTVRGRRREIAIRSAIGARPAEIRGMVLRQGMIVVGLGVVVGVAGAVTAGRILSGMLYGVRAVDPVVLLGTAAVLIGAALLANWIPAVHATRIEPRVALTRE